MKKLLVYLKAYRKESILGPLFKLIEATFELLVPLVVAAIIDTGIAQRDTGYIGKMCLLLVGLAVVGLVCAITAQFFAAKAAVGFVTKLKHVLFSHIQKLSYTELDKIGTSTLITRLTSDMNQVQNGVNLFLRLFLRSPFVVFGAMVMAFTIDSQVAWTFVIVIAALSVVVFGIMLISIPLYKKVQGHLDEVTTSTRENLTGVRVIRAFCGEAEEIEKFDQRNERLTSVQKYVGRISALMNPVTYVLINVATIVLIWQGAIRVETGILTQGAVVALYNYMSQILVELIKLANMSVNLTKCVACGNRIQAILDLKSSITPPEQAKVSENPAVAVEFSNVSLRYKDAGDCSLTGINFTALQGETIGIIGGTGSGKTSLVNLIPRFYDTTEGTVKVQGVDVREYDPEVLREKIGLVPQKAVLFQGSIRENMRWGNADASDEEILQAIELAQAKDVLKSKEEGLDFAIEQGGKNLSGGQRQRFTIARALVRKPEILILDDSSSALDFATDAALRKALRSMPGDPTVFIISQRTSSLQHADKIVVLEDGNMVGLGTHEELLNTCAVYQEIYNSQFGQ